MAGKSDQPLNIQFHSVCTPLRPIHDSSYLCALNPPQDLNRAHPTQTAVFF